MFEELYPKDFEEFLNWFPDEETCLEYIKKLRWPDGFLCSKCGSVKAWKTNRGLMHCAGCNYQMSVTTGTIFQDSRKSLRLWFYVLWLMMAQKTGISAKNLKEIMSFGSYKTTWCWLHKLRRIMIVPSKERLKGIIGS